MRESRQPPSFKQEQKSRDERRACSGTAFLVVGEVGRVGNLGRVGRVGWIGRVGKVATRSTNTYPAYPAYPTYLAYLAYSAYPACLAYLAYSTYPIQAVSWAIMSSLVLVLQSFLKMFPISCNFNMSVVYFSFSFINFAALDKIYTNRSFL